MCLTTFNFTYTRKVYIFTLQSNGLIHSYIFIGECQIRWVIYNIYRFKVINLVNLLSGEWRKSSVNWCPSSGEILAPLLKGVIYWFLILISNSFSIIESWIYIPYCLGLIHSFHQRYTVDGASVDLTILLDQQGHIWISPFRDGLPGKGW